jgi:hypothetical protein
MLPMLQEGTGMTLGYTDLPDPSAVRCRSAHEMIERMSDKWSLHVIGTLRKGPCRFNEIRRAIDGVARLIGWADKNQSVIAEARQRYDEANTTDLPPRPKSSHR